MAKVSAEERDGIPMAVISDCRYLLSSCPFSRREGGCSVLELKGSGESLVVDGEWESVSPYGLDYVFLSGNEGRHTLTAPAVCSQRE